MERDIKKLISQMTLEEKAGMCSGLDFWKLKGVKRLGIPSIKVTDGPHGLRKQAEKSDPWNFSNNVQATCFPSGSGIAATWDRKLIENVGIAIGEECQAENIAVLLGPAVNIKRSPLCGRNFEYLSEDPYLSSEMAANYIKGVQSQGVGTSIKHFAVNNQEYRRMSIDTIVDERTLREIYLASFEGAIKQSKPWTVMCSYNQVNGEFASQNHYLLTDILRGDWGYEGMVVSDWGAVDDRVQGLTAGMDLEMPSSSGIRDKKIVEAVKSGKLAEDILNKAVERILTMVFKAVDNKKPNATYDKDAHHKLAKKVASECVVLLKNEGNILPLKKEGTIAVLGAFAKDPRYQGGGSSHIVPTKIDNAFDEIERILAGRAKLIYAKGYNPDEDNIDEALIVEAKTASANSNVAVVFAGLREYDESEGYDRVHMRMPESHIRLIEAVEKVQKNVVVVLNNGSPIEMPWLYKAKGVLECYLGGQAGGGAAADLLFGNANPSGKLTETFPKKLSDNPSYLNFPGEGNRLEYREGIFVGYRYYDKKEIEPLFPFGYGLSYTSFAYTGISVDKKEINDDDIVTVSVKVKNSGKRPGKEVVQLYVRDIESTMNRPDKELKGFEKVELQPGEEKTVIFTLNKRAFAYYNVVLQDWHVESGAFEILVGGSSTNISLKELINVISTTTIRTKFTRNTTIGELMADPAGAIVAQQFVKDMPTAPELSIESTASMAMMNNLPLRMLITFSNGKIDEEKIEAMLAQLNCSSQDII